MMKNPSKKKVNVFKKNFEVLKLVFRFCPLLLPFSIFNIIANVISSLVRVYLISYVTNSVLTTNIDDFFSSAVFKKILIIVLIELITVLYKTIYSTYIEPRFRSIYMKRVQHYLFDKVKEIDMEQYDNPEFYDKYNRALRDSQWRGFRVFATCMNFIKNLAVTIALGTYIIISDTYLILIIIVSAVISYFAVSKMNKLFFSVYKETSKESRFYWYVNRTFYQQQYAAELKTTNVSNLLIEKYQDSVKTLEAKYLENDKKVLKYQIINNLSYNIITQAGTYIYLAYRMIKSTLDEATAIAGFTSMINATIQFASNFSSLAWLAIDLKEHALYVDDFLWVIDYKPTIEKDEGLDISKFECLSVKNIDFKYAGTDKLVIKNLSLDIHKGEHIAFVGYNGSGKSTLIKLLLKFYNPSSGNIYYNGVNYTDLNPKKLRKNISVVFQDYTVYAVSVAENILMRKILNKEDEELVWDAIEKVGLKEKILSLKDGIYTELSREFSQSGEAFSGGELQKIVIARVFASNADIYILDEPTASLDPFAEARINKLIMDASIDKTIIIIAHRLSSVVDADKIYLLKNGYFTEQGTHDELVKLNGDYAEMFNKQKNLYIKQSNNEE